MTTLLFVESGISPLAIFGTTLVLFIGAFLLASLNSKKSPARAKK